MAAMPMGVFLSMVMLRARSVMTLVETSRSWATLTASLPVSSWMLLMCALISARSFCRCCTIESSTLR